MKVYVYNYPACPDCGKKPQSLHREPTETPTNHGWRHYKAGPAVEFHPCGCHIDVDSQAWCDYFNELTRTNTVKGR